MVVLLTGGVGGANRRPSIGGDAYGIPAKALFLHVLYLEQVLVSLCAVNCITCIYLISPVFVDSTGGKSESHCLVPARLIRFLSNG
ncbi:MAG: hypothetical protein Ct9H90mP5_03960 [Acidimicrobiaceae bacterium]|nr:MAG: hypothetical protein Ct9H90mP5_03960 [Acidimicrobiaceae bacterium]